MPRTEDGDPFVRCDGDGCENRIFTDVKHLEEYQRKDAKWYCSDCTGDGNV